MLGRLVERDRNFWRVFPVRINCGSRAGGDDERHGDHADGTDGLVE